MNDYWKLRRSVQRMHAFSRGTLRVALGLCVLCLVFSALLEDWTLIGLSIGAGIAVVGASHLVEWLHEKTIKELSGDE